MTHKFLPLAALALSASTAAQAQGIEYLSYGADYTQLSLGDESVNLFTLGGSIDYRVNNAFVNAGVAFTDVSGDEGDASITGVSARGGYFIVPQAVIYGGLNYIDTDDSESFSSYNVGAEYMFNAVTVGVNYEESDDDGFEESTTLYGSYQISNAVELGVFFTNSDGDTSTSIGYDFDNGQYDISAVFTDADGFNIFGIDASYDFGNGFRASGNFARFDEELDYLAIGGGYEVSEDLWIDLEVGRLEGDETVDVIGLALTYEMGDETLLIDRGESAQIEALGVLGRIGELGGL